MSLQGALLLPSVFCDIATTNYEEMILSLELLAKLHNKWNPVGFTEVSVLFGF